jgi:hypothetical protein
MVKMKIGTFWEKGVCVGTLDTLGTRFWEMRVGGKTKLAEQGTWERRCWRKGAKKVKNPSGPFRPFRDRTEGLILRRI